MTLNLLFKREKKERGICNSLKIMLQGHKSESYCKIPHVFTKQVHKPNVKSINPLRLRPYTRYITLR